MNNPLVCRLAQFNQLSCADKQAIERISSENVRKVAPPEDLISEGDEPKTVNVILEGWACRYKHLEDGRRQIIGFLLPGDICDLHMDVLREMDHSIGTISAVTLAEISSDTIAALPAKHPAVTRGLWWLALVAAAIQREWIVSLGQRHAVERIAHLLCELFMRLRSAGLTDGDSCQLPLTQADIADASGLSNVHANRVLQELRARQLIRLKNKVLTVPDLPALMRAAHFNPAYLHLYANRATASE